LLATLNAPFLLAWGVARVVIFATWSYPLQRDFVFAENADSHRQPAVHREPTVASRP